MDSERQQEAPKVTREASGSRALFLDSVKGLTQLLDSELHVALQKLTPYSHLCSVGMAEQGRDLP